MHADVFQIVPAGLLVLLGSEAREPLFEDVDAQGVAAREENVDTKVKFKAVDEEGFGYVELGDVVLGDGDVFGVLN